MKYALFILIIICLFSNPLASQVLIPAPRKEIRIPGKIDETLAAGLRFIYTSDPILKPDMEVLNEWLKAASVPELQVKVSPYDVVSLQFDRTLKDEEYRFINKGNNHLEIRGGRDGVFRGLTSLFQYLFAAKDNKKLLIPNLNDDPAFTWRGIHLDVSRHFFPTSFIKKYIDLLAMHKMNSFHWHLTDDQGWRIEIKKYPLLTQIGSKRSETMVAKNFDPFIGDGKKVEGYYTQDEIKDIVAYAQKRHINIIPEIEMPGHAQAALSAYPQYSCNKKKLDVLTKWGVSDDVFCTDEATIRFLQDVLDEVMALFPSRYIHIGGDEVPKTRWKACPVCQRTMKMNSLKDEHELQSYFIKRMDTYLTSKGRNVIGWDEILEGGLAPNAAVMSWRGEEGGIQAAKQKHSVVMSPGTHCYFDHYQGNKNTEPLAIGGYTPVEKVYSYQPLPAALNQNEKKYILGAQANVWTEYIPTTEHVEYMVLPRLCALAEVLWTGETKPGFKDFAARLRKHFNLLDQLKVNYAKSIFDVNATSRVEGDKIEVQLHTNYDKGAIQYHFTDEEPYVNKMNFSPEKPILLDHSRQLKAVYLEDGNTPGNTLSMSFIVHKALGKTIHSSIEPSKYYNEQGLPKLLDGKSGTLPKVASEWLAWNGADPEFEIDMGIVKELNSLDLYTLKEEVNQIYLPERLEISLSSDGKEYDEIRVLTLEGIQRGYDIEQKVSYPLNGVSARFVKLKLTCAPRIPARKPGEGEAAWLFLSELAVE